MERENKKLRDDHRKEYNDTVRHLVSFVQNRDPRFHAYQREKAKAAKSSQPPSGSATPRGGRGQTPTLRDKRISELHAEMARQREEARMKDANNFQAQSWQEVDTSIFDEFEDGPAAPTKSAKPAVANGAAPLTGNDEEIEDDEDEEPTGYECVACNKTFMSENAWDNHERSKKHKQAVFR
jgi:DnaJ family protein A protein 5